MVGGAVAHPAATTACPGVLCQETGREPLRLRSGQAVLALRQFRAGAVG